jgi:uncharacterized membrane protein YhaH (DUF805 family)
MHRKAIGKGLYLLQIRVYATKNKELEMNEFMTVMKKYAVFSGRASRREYWMFTLFAIIIAFILGFVEGLSGLNENSGQSVLGGLFNLAIFIPSIAVAVRRAHDTGKSGWWILVPIYSFILMVLPGDKGDNAHGADPYAEVSTPVDPSAV